METNTFLYKRDVGLEPYNTTLKEGLEAIKSDAKGILKIGPNLEVVVIPKAWMKDNSESILNENLSNLNTVHQEFQGISQRIVTIVKDEDPLWQECNQMQTVVIQLITNLGLLIQKMVDMNPQDQRISIQSNLTKLTGLQTQFSLPRQRLTTKMEETTKPDTVAILSFPFCHNVEPNGFVHLATKLIEKKPHTPELHAMNDTCLIAHQGKVWVKIWQEEKTQVFVDFETREITVITGHLLGNPIDALIGPKDNPQPKSSENIFQIIHCWARGMELLGKDKKRQANDNVTVNLVAVTVSCSKTPFQYTNRTINLQHDFKNPAKLIEKLHEMLPKSPSSDEDSTTTNPKDEAPPQAENFLKKVEKTETVEELIALFDEWFLPKNVCERHAEELRFFSSEQTDDVGNSVDTILNYLNNLLDDRALPPTATTQIIEAYQYLQERIQFLADQKESPQENQALNEAIYVTYKTISLILQGSESKDYIEITKRLELIEDEWLRDKKWFFRHPLSLVEVARIFYRIEWLESKGVEFQIESEGWPCFVISTKLNGEKEYILFLGSVEDPKDNREHVVKEIGFLWKAKEYAVLKKRIKATALREQSLFQRLSEGVKSDQSIVPRVFGTFSPGNDPYSPYLYIAIALVRGDNLTIKLKYNDIHKEQKIRLIAEANDVLSHLHHNNVIAGVLYSSKFVCIPSKEGPIKLILVDGESLSKPNKTGSQLSLTNLKGTFKKDDFQWFPPEFYRSVSQTIQNISVTLEKFEPDYQSDMWMLGILVYEIYRGPLNPDKYPFPPQKKIYADFYSKLGSPMAGSDPCTHEHFQIQALGKNVENHASKRTLFPPFDIKKWGGFSTSRSATFVNELLSILLNVTPASRSCPSAIRSRIKDYLNETEVVLNLENIEDDSDEA